ETEDRVELEDDAGKRHGAGQCSDAIPPFGWAAPRFGWAAQGRVWAAERPRTAAFGPRGEAAVHARRSESIRCRLADNPLVGMALSGLCRRRPRSAYRNGRGGPSATSTVRRRIVLDPRGSRHLGASRRGRAEPTPIPGPEGGGPGVGPAQGEARWAHAPTASTRTTSSLSGS